jgi:hypothetical protein
MDITIIIMHRIRNHTPKNLQLTFNNKISIKIVNKNLFLIKIVNKNLFSIKIPTNDLASVNSLQSKTIQKKINK